VNFANGVVACATAHLGDSRIVMRAAVVTPLPRGAHGHSRGVRSWSRVRSLHMGSAMKTGSRGLPSNSTLQAAIHGHTL